MTFVPALPRGPGLPCLLTLPLTMLLLLPMSAAQAEPSPAKATAALTVSVTTPQRAEWPRTLAAAGNVAAWQEASIGAEITNARLAEVLVNVGDVVKKGQLLGRLADETWQADKAQAKAGLAEALAMQAEAKQNAERARQLRISGAMSAQQATALLTAEQTAETRVLGAQARLQAAEARLAQTRILAPDHGIISARIAALGSLTMPNQELFRMIRGGRLEWRAEVPANDLALLKVGMPASLTVPGAEAVTGKVRMVGPTVDPQTRNGLIYVDIQPPAGHPLRAGMFARGSFDLGPQAALALPQSAVLLRDGFSYVYRIETVAGKSEPRVAQTKVAVGRRLGDRIEITAGLAADARVVDSGVGFLSDGDVVRVVAGAAKKP